ncbi:hypothetical protein ACK280_26835, partial [Mycobacterium sherrisii]|uniref:hypothetical protein n=1 Tax=Mycobacterium sherrisii TaxID=243061 RepID=UPI00397482F1
EGRPTPEGDHSTNLRITTRGGDFYMATSEDFDLAIDTLHQRSELKRMMHGNADGHDCPA